ncbi:TadE/TadG family type IV pilus assembly protein [Fulvimarina sp. 2208YS6-2-32]|nr:TadE/TadG family type IV pilus assembly protein [Fulvimarina sp. 2208YS6-2-32]
MRRAIGAFARARDGAVAIEFVLVLPILVLLYLGAFEGSKLFEVSRKANTATETIGDLVGRTRSVTLRELNNIFDVARAIISPFDPGELDVQISAISIDPQGKATVDWSRKRSGAGTQSMPGLAKGSPYALPPDLKATGNLFYIIVDTRYSYHSPLIHSVIASSLDIDMTYGIVPRLSSIVPCSDCG